MEALRNPTDVSYVTYTWKKQTERADRETKRTLEEERQVVDQALEHKTKKEKDDKERRKQEKKNKGKILNKSSGNSIAGVQEEKDKKTNGAIVKEDGGQNIPAILAAALSSGTAVKTAVAPPVIVMVEDIEAQFEGQQQQGKMTGKDIEEVNVAAPPVTAIGTNLLQVPAPSIPYLDKVGERKRKKQEIFARKIQTKESIKMAAEEEAMWALMKVEAEAKLRELEAAVLETKRTLTRYVQGEERVKELGRSMASLGVSSGVAAATPPPPSQFPLSTLAGASTATATDISSLSSTSSMDGRTTHSASSIGGGKASTTMHHPSAAVVPTALIAPVTAEGRQQEEGGGGNDSGRKEEKGVDDTPASASMSATVAVGPRRQQHQDDDTGSTTSTISSKSEKHVTMLLPPASSSSSSSKEPVKSLSSVSSSNDKKGKISAAAVTAAADFPGSETQGRSKVTPSPSVEKEQQQQLLQELSLSSSSQRRVEIGMNSKPPPSPASLSSVSIASSGGIPSSSSFQNATIDRNRQTSTTRNSEKRRAIFTSTSSSFASSNGRLARQNGNSTGAVVTSSDTNIYTRRCKFFGSARGCDDGIACLFRHDLGN